MYWKILLYNLIIASLMIMDIYCDYIHVMDGFKPVDLNDPVSKKALEEILKQLSDKIEFFKYFIIKINSHPYCRFLDVISSLES